MTDETIIGAAGRYLGSKAPVRKAQLTYRGAAQSMLDNAPVGSVGAPGGVLPTQAAPKRTDVGKLAMGGASLIPGVGDAIGLASDAYQYASDPQSRTWMNYLLTGLGALPMVPNMAAIVNMPRPKWAGKGMDVAVGIDPTPGEYIELLDETGEYADKNWRGILRTMEGPDGKRYVWPVGDAQHDDVAAHFGLSRDPKDHGGLIFSEDINPNWRPRKR